MKNRLTLISIATVLLCALSCSQDGAQELQTGDLLFVGIPADYSLDDDSMSSAISDATGHGDINFIHTAIIEVDSLGAAWIIDATIKHGVDRHPIDTMFRDFTLKDGSQPEYVVMRLQNNSNAPQYVENAKKFIGEVYNEHFTPGPGRHYCTELVYDSYIENGEHIFRSAPMNFLDKDGEMPVYWTQLFALLGEDVPQGVPGTNPQEMQKDPQLVRVRIEGLGR